MRQVHILITYTHKREKWGVHFQSLVYTTCWVMNIFKPFLIHKEVNILILLMKSLWYMNLWLDAFHQTVGKEAFNCMGNWQTLQLKYEHFYKTKLISNALSDAFNKLLPYLNLGRREKEYYMKHLKNFNISVIGFTLLWEGKSEGNLPSPQATITVVLPWNDMQQDIQKQNKKI